MMPFASQFGGTPGAEAMWWNTDVSRTQWLTVPNPPTMTTSNDHPSTA